MAETPTTAFVLSLLGGIFITIGGFVVIGIGVLVQSLASSEGLGGIGRLGGLGGLSSLTGGLGNLTSISGISSGAGTSLAATGGTGVVLGIAAVGIAMLMNRSPERHQLWGSLVLAVSVASWVTSLGGLLVGFLLGLIGGVLAISWKPSVVTPTPQPQITRICSACGTVLQQDAKFCPHCGKPLA